jgi:hypothetical protein
MTSEEKKIKVNILFVDAKSVLLPIGLPEQGR